MKEKLQPIERGAAFVPRSNQAPNCPQEAHHERQKEKYASNPDIDTAKSKYNFHIVKPEGRYYHFIQNRIEQAGCCTRKDSTRFVDTLITANPEFFKGKSPKEIQAFFQRAADFLIQRVLDRIPPDVLAELKRQQQYRKER